MLIGMMYEHNASSPNYGIAEKIIELGKNLILKLENIIKKFHTCTSSINRYAIGPHFDYASKIAEYDSDTMQAYLLRRLL